MYMGRKTVEWSFCGPQVSACDVASDLVESSDQIICAGGSQGNGTNTGLGWRFVNRQDEDDALGTLGYVSFRGGGAFNTIQ
jgi:hypothetical protein